MNHFFFLSTYIPEQITDFITAGELPDITERAVTGDFFNTLEFARIEDTLSFTTASDLREVSELGATNDC